MMRIDVLTLFPDLFDPFRATSIVGRAASRRLVELSVIDLRDFAADRHHSVDDRPFGGGPGMVLMCGPVFAAVEHVKASRKVSPRLILLSPQGERFNQSLAVELSTESNLLLLCGHYEGFDERIRQGLAPQEVSIGDYVLSGGELPAMVLIDAIVRLLPGALGHPESVQDESFSAGPLEYPQYTRPREFRSMRVPEVLLSGDHAMVEQWRREQSLERTRQRRPDLLAAVSRHEDADRGAALPGRAGRPDPPQNDKPAR